jgi:inner membrane protein
MFFFGHIGVTMGVVRAYEHFTKSVNSSDNGPDSEHLPTAADGGIISPSNRFQGVTDKIDYRLVVIGSMLPDIIDKPMWLLTHNSFIWAGRGYAHTFLFNFILLVSGIILKVRRKTSWLLLISICSFGHLVLDKMWQNPYTLWWPLLGPMQQGEFAGWLSSVFSSLTSNPEVYIPEIIGLVIFIYFAIRVIATRNLLNSVKTGHLPVR